MIRLTINGTERELCDGTTIAGYLREKDIDPLHVVAEVNGSIVPREQFESFSFTTDDKVELIRFVGGG